MDDVRALTLHQPWATLVALGVKTIETRSAPTAYRGRLLIHAGVRPALHAFRLGTWTCERTWGEERGLLDEAGNAHRLPYGAVVASAVLTDCVPTESLVWRGSPHDHGRRWIQVVDQRDAPVRLTEVVHDEKPFGAFSPGRWAWLLDDVKPTTERCPHCWWELNTWTTPIDAHRALGCSTCDGEGVCEPVAMRGKQGLWTPTWETS